MYAQSRKFGKPILLESFESKKSKGPKIHRQNRLRAPIHQGGKPSASSPKQ
jgi:hypothetical protein